MTTGKREVAIKSVIEHEHLVYAEVYAPGIPDTDVEFMTEHQIRKMAHRFIMEGNLHAIDQEHNNVLVEGAGVVESFIADESDTRFITGAWVVGMFIPDPVVWQKVLDGEINGFSMEATVFKDDVLVEVFIPPILKGTTSPGKDGHTHAFSVGYNNDGVFMGGMTEPYNGHSHVIKRGTSTEDSAGHSHRFSSVDGVQIQNVIRQQ